MANNEQLITNIHIANLVDGNRIFIDLICHL